MASSVAIPKARPLVASTLLSVTAAAATVVAAPVAQTTAVAPIFVSYHAPSICPDRAAFIQRLLPRITATTLTDDSKLGRTVSVTLDSEGDQFLGRMEFEDGVGHFVLRTVRANQCEEVVSAMAFVTALAIDSLVTATLNRDHREPTEDPSSGGQPGEGDSRSVPPVMPGRKVPLTQTPPKHEPKAAPKAPIAHEAALGVGIVSGLVGHGVAMGARLEWGLGPKPLLPLLRVAATWTDARTAVEMSQSRDAAHFQLLAGDAQLCVGKVLIAPTLLTGAFCSGFELGRYLAEGVPQAPGQTQRGHFPMLWSSVLSSLHLRVEGDRMFFDFSPTIRFPLVRRDFVTLAPDHDVFSIPFAAFGVTWSMGMSFR